MKKLIMLTGFLAISSTSLAYTGSCLYFERLEGTESKRPSDTRILTQISLSVVGAAQSIRTVSRSGQIVTAQITLKDEQTVQLEVRNTKSVVIGESEVPVFSPEVHVLRSQNLDDGSLALINVVCTPEDLMQKFQQANSK